MVDPVLLLVLCVLMDSSAPAQALTNGVSNLEMRVRVVDKTPSGSVLMDWNVSTDIAVPH